MMAGISGGTYGGLYGAFTSAPYTSQPVGAPAHHFALQQPPIRQRASPAPSQQLDQSQSQSQSTPASASKFPMAPPQTPGTPNSPQSPETQAREQQRIGLLFDINIELFSEVQRLQNEGKGGAISQQQAMQMQREGKPDTMASDEYIQCLRRVQANLAYLMPKASTDPAQQAKAPLGPAHMTAPPHMPQLQEQYARLRELFPSWRGFDHRPSGSGASASSPRLNAPNGMTGPFSANTPTQN